MPPAGQLPLLHHGTPTTGVVTVPDQRLAKNLRTHQPRPRPHLRWSFIDIAGIVEGARKGEAWQSFRPHPRDRRPAATLSLPSTTPRSSTLRAAVNPRMTSTFINTSLLLADLETVEKSDTPKSKRSTSPPTPTTGQGRVRRSTPPNPPPPPPPIQDSKKPAKPANPPAPSNYRRGTTLHRDLSSSRQDHPALRRQRRRVRPHHRQPYTEAVEASRRRGSQVVRICGATRS